MEKIKNLALKSYPVFFNRLNMGIHSDGTLESLRYVDKTPGTTVYDDGTVEFAFFAPDAKSVEVCGVSGTLPKEHIELKKEEDGWSPCSCWFSLSELVRRWSCLRKS